MKADRDTYLAEVRAGIDAHALVVTILISPDEEAPEEAQGEECRINLKVIANTNNDALVLEGLYHALNATSANLTEKMSGERVPEQIVLPPNGIRKLGEFETHNGVNGPLLIVPREVRDA